MINLYPPRIQAFRDDMIKLLPRAPNNKASRELLEAMPTRKIILAFLTWRMRLIPTKPRRVALWSGGVKPLQFMIAKPKLQPLLQKVEAGRDITPHLSDLVNKKGIILPGASLSDRGKDIDMVLTRHGLHHFHVNIVTPNNPKGRSGSLVFAEVLEAEFRIVAISDHHAFQSGSAEQTRFFNICYSYMAKDVPPGQGFMPNPVMTSGHSMLVTMFALKCEDEISRIDHLMDDPAFINGLYNDYNNQITALNGNRVIKPDNSCLSWHFDDLKFGICDKKTKVFFCIFPFFAR